MKKILMGTFLLLLLLYFFPNQSVEMSKVTTTDVEGALNDLLEFEIKTPMYLEDITWRGASITYHDDEQAKIELFGNSDENKEVAVRFVASLVELEKRETYTWEEIEINSKPGLIARPNAIFIQWEVDGPTYRLQGNNISEEKLLKITESLG
ncbi:DUF4367 domain-containing protein [Bacillus shivajii]|uniref:DUF4367 domain-containing protein n=1 Tax=Bacillus shivajii TaxID=1983719 RepID=UPI001CF9C367|nr:DUF4367 domain-containing protein [Bacillus shivajii]UCZ51472.1 DUF4367 domain-containing protein [Bacillus shivajii]